MVVAHLGKGGGVALQASQLLEALRRRVDVNLLCLDAPGPHQALAREPGVVTAGPLKFPNGIVSLTRYLRSVRGEYDVFQIWDAYYAAPAAYSARVFPRVNCLGTDPGVEITGRYGPAAGMFTRVVMVPLLAQGSLVVNSPALAERFRAHRPRLIPNGLDRTKFDRLPAKEDARRRHGLPADKTILVSVAKVIPEKRVEWILEVLRRVPTAMAVIVGGTTEEHYGDRYYRQLLVSYKDVTNRVIFTGEVPWRVVLEYLAAADMFVFASPWEGLPNAVLEAMAAGRPAVVSDIPPHRQIVDHGRTGFLANDLDAMTRFVELLAADPRMGNEIGARARAFVFEHFSFDRIVEMYLDLYRAILGATPGRTTRRVSP